MPKCVNNEAPSRESKYLKNQINQYCNKYKKIPCKALGRRPIFLSEYLECTINRKDKNKRMPFFFVALELLKTSTEFTKKEIHGKVCFEFMGQTPSGKIFGVHVREENQWKDRKLYLISTFV